MGRLSLWFFDQDMPQLEQAALEHSFSGGVRRCRRGKTAGALQADGTFQWTSAVKAFAVLALRTAASALGSDRTTATLHIEVWCDGVAIQGQRELSDMAQKIERASQAALGGTGQYQDEGVRTA